MRTYANKELENILDTLEMKERYTELYEKIYNDTITEEEEKEWNKISVQMFTEYHRRQVAFFKGMLG